MTATETATDYTKMTWAEIRRLAKERGIRGNLQRDAIIRMMREQDGAAVTPETAPAVNIAGRRATRTHVHAEQHTRDATRIVDEQGNMVAMVYRLGRVVGDERAVMDMEANVNRIIGAFNRT